MNKLITIVELAGTLKCNRCTIRNWARDNNVHISKLSTSNNKMAIAISRHDGERFAKYWADATTIPNDYISIPDFAKQYSLDKKTVRDWLRKTGREVRTARKSNSPPVSLIHLNDAESFKLEYSLGISEEIVPISDIQQQYHISWRTINNWIKGSGCKTYKVKTPTNKYTNGLLAIDAANCRDFIEKLRTGYFYFVQLIPRHNPNRVKLGFATMVEARMKSYKTICPEAKVLATWTCKREDEKIAIKAITSKNCIQVAEEVFDFKDFQVALDTANRYFQ